MEEERSGNRMPYLPALDGLRAVALMAVICFHAGFTWIRGGYLPLTAFFVLSGFLITSLLLLERQRNGRISLGAFWGRRARRLVPAAIVALALIAVYTLAVHRPAPGLQGDVFSALTWVTNWRFIFAGRSYTDLFGDPSPLQHFWSLAVEEQFYLILPLIAVGTLLLAKGKRWLFVTVIAVLAVASTIEMRLLFDPNTPPLRAYFGTDTRAAELLVGVLLACVMIGPHGLRRFTGWSRHLVDLAGVAALGVTVWFWFATHEYDSRLYEGGLLGIAVLAAIVVVAGTQPGTIVSRLLGLWPLAAFGRISYGVYLFHWPIFLWLTEDRTGLAQGPLFALRMAATTALAVVSYHLLEWPIRRNRQPMRLQLTSWANASIGIAAILAVVSTASPSAAITLQTADGPAPTVITASTSTTSTTTTTMPASSAPAATATSSTAAPAAGRTAGHTGGASSSSPTSAVTTTTAPPPPLKVMVVGDSIAVNLATGLQDHLQQYGDMQLLNYAFNGCSAVTDGTMEWPDGSQHTVASNCAARKSEWASQVRSFQPDVVLIHSSIFDIYDRQIDPGGPFLPPDDPTFQSWLRQEDTDVLNTLGAEGALVVWASIPCAHFDPAAHPNHFENTEGNRRINVVNQIIRSTGVSILNFAGEVCPGGQYSDTVAGVSGARPDGVHLTDAAAAAVANQWLAPLLHKLTH